MTKRKGKSSTKQEESLALLEPSVVQPRGMKEYVVPAAIFFIFIVGGSTAVWFCSQQQQTIDSLLETVNAMQLRVTKFQQQLGMGNAQVFVWCCALLLFANWSICKLIKDQSDLFKGCLWNEINAIAHNKGQFYAHGFLGTQHCVRGGIYTFGILKFGYCFGKSK